VKPGQVPEFGKVGWLSIMEILGELWERKDGEVPEGARKLGIDGWSYQVMPVVLWRVGTGGLW
jgi:hypothetical protein